VLAQQILNAENSESIKFSAPPIFGEEGCSRAKATNSPSIGVQNLPLLKFITQSL